MENRQSHTDAFAPKAAMFRYARACAAHDVPAEDEARCRVAGVSPRTLTRWRATPGFSEWIRGEIRRLLSERVWEIWAVLNRLARSGNIQAAKLLLDHFAPESDGLSSVGPDTFRALAELARTSDSDTGGTET